MEIGKGLVSWLSFNNSPTKDFVSSNNWSVVGTPYISSENAINGNALQLDGHSGLKCTLKLGGQDFTIDGWVYVDSATQQWARIVNIFSKVTGNPMIILERPTSTSTKFNLWDNYTQNMTNYEGRSKQSSVDCVGKRVHFRICYYWSNYSLQLYINGTRVAYVSATQYPEQDYDVYIGTGSQDLNEDLGIIGSIDELTIFNGVALNNIDTNFTPPESSYYDICAVPFDTARLVRDSKNSWRYENYGTADLLTVAGTTVTNLPITASKTGSAFYQKSAVKCFDIPATKEIWIKCDTYSGDYDNSGSGGYYWTIFNHASEVNDRTGFTFNYVYQEAYVYINDNRLITIRNTLKKNTLHTILLHMVSDPVSGIFELWVDGAKIYTYTGNVNNGDDFADIYLRSYTAGDIFSNVIISNNPVDTRENVYRPTDLAVVCDLERNVLSSVASDIDTARYVTSPQEVNIDTSRSIEKFITLSADILRDVAKTVTVDFDTSRNVQGDIPVDFSVDVLRNVTQSQELNVDLARSVSAPIDINFDICRAVTNSSIWRYENYGTASLLKVSGNTVTGLDATKSKTGSAFWQTQRVAVFPIPATKELWVKFDLYYGGTQWRAYDRLNGKDTGVGRYQQATSLTSFINGPLEYTLNPKNSITSGKLYTFLLHMISDAENGLVELWVDGQKYYSDDFADEGLIYKGNVENGADFENFYLQSQDKNNLFSNVIISNAPIGLGENVLGYNIQWFFDFDLVRQNGYSCLLNLDSKRNVTKGIIVCVDVNRNVQSPVNLFFDTSRTVSKAQVVPIVLNLDAVRAVTNNVDFFVDSVRNLNCTINFFLDTLRKTRTEAFFRYENYGTADLLTVSGTTLENLDKSQSVYQTAFYQTERVKCFDIPATKEIWIKCDTYIQQELNHRLRIYNGRSNYTTGVCSQSAFGQLDIWVNDKRVKDFTEILKTQQLQTILLHMVSDADNGIVEAWVDGEKIYTYTGNVNEGDDFADIYLQSTGSKIFFSNVIISNDEIGLHDNVKVNQDFLCDTFRFEPIAYQASIDICRDIIKPITQTHDTCLNIVKSQSIDFDTFLFIESTVQFNADLVRALPHEIILSPLAESADLIDTSNDDKAQLQSLEIRLNEQYLTDELIITTVRPMDIMEQVKGQYLDYKFDMRIETEKQRGILRTCTCCSDIDEILYKQLDYTIPDDEMWYFTNPDEIKQRFPGITAFDFIPLDPETDDEGELALASTHIATIADIIGKTPVLQFADFVSTVDITAGGSTYNDLIRSIFGWSARIPQHMINCFLRDNKLFVIQRGFEQNEINLDNNISKYEVVGTDKDLIRTIWGSSVWSKTETREVYGYMYMDNLKWSNEEEEKDDEEEEEEKPEPKSTRNTGGLIKKRIEEHDGVTTTTEYEYTSDDLVAKTIITVESKDFYTTRTTTTYEYATLEDGRRVLEKETIEETVQVDGQWKIVDKKTTKHEYTATGPGQVHHYNTDSDGNVSNVIGNGTYDDRFTPYSKFVMAKGHKRLLSYTTKPKYFQAQRTIYGLTPFDTSFPVHGDEKLIEITNAIKWLNRRTQETVTLNIFDYPHVIDFNDRLVFNGNVYYLKSNTAIKTSRIVNKQTLSIVRWY